MILFMILTQVRVKYLHVVNQSMQIFDKMIFNPFKYQNDIIDNDDTNAVNSKCM